MTAPPTTPARPAGQGTVFDIGYRRYTGEREGRDRSRRAVCKDGIRAALGLGRGARAQSLPRIFIGILLAIGLIMAIIAGAANKYIGEGAAERFNIPSHADYYGIVSMILFVFAAIVAPELLCRDKRDGVINLYLVRPLSGSDYIISRWAAFFFVMLGVTWAPQALLFLGLCLGSPEPLTYLTSHWLDVPRFLAAGMAFSVYVTTLALLTASFTNRRAYAAVFLVGLFVISTPFTLGLAQQIGGAPGQWISMFNLTNIPLHISDLIFGEASDLTKDAPARQLGPTILSLWYVAWTVIPGTVLWSRYRRLKP